MGSALGAGSWAAPAGLAPAASGRPGTVRTFADEPYFNSIIYPDSELEVGGPAPDFTLAGGLGVAGGSGAPRLKRGCLRGPPFCPDFCCSSGSSSSRCGYLA